jgi:hypothetical protein
MDLTRLLRRGPCRHSLTPAYAVLHPTTHRACTIIILNQTLYIVRRWNAQGPCRHLFTDFRIVSQQALDHSYIKGPGAVGWECQRQPVHQSIAMQCISRTAPCCQLLCAASTATVRFACKHICPSGSQCRDRRTVQQPLSSTVAWEQGRCLQV